MSSSFVTTRPHRAEGRLDKWRTIFEAMDLDLALPVNRVKALDIKSITGEEPRLMAKIDRRDELPAVLAEIPSFLLPVANGEYVVVHGDGYHDLERVVDQPAPHISRLPFTLTSATAGASETQHIDFAFNSGLVERFAGIGSLFLAIRGRKRAPSFDFRVGGVPLKASSVQVEIDAGFEAEHHIVVLEGKIGAPSSFHIRQLYYPYRFWQTIVPEKEIIPVFFTYQPDQNLSTFWHYRFRDPEDYLSIELVRAKSFVIQPSRANILPERSVPREHSPRLAANVIPQADDVRKIIEFPFRVAEGLDRAADIARAYEFNERQSRYYSEAAEAVGLVSSQDGRYALTETGAAFVRLPVQQRNELLFRQMLRLPVMYEILVELFLRPEKALNRDDIATIISRMSTLKGDTLRRRSQTLLAWLRWVHRSVGVIQVDGTIVRIGMKGLF